MMPALIKPWDGKPITEPGIYSGIPIEVYHSATICAPEPKISSSGLRDIWSESPAYYWSRSPYNPRRVEQKPSEAQLLGSATHTLIVGGEIFSERFVIRPEKLLNPDTNKERKWHGNNPECKAWLAAQPKGLSVLTEEQLYAVREMAISLGRQPVIAAGLLNGGIELSMFWRDRKTGIWLSARPDATPNDSGDFGELKTTRSTLYVRLQYSLDEYGYPQQAGLVAEGARELGIPFENFVYAFVQNEEPFCSRINTLVEEDLARGARMNRVCIDRFAECIKRYGIAKDSYWPGPGGEQSDAEYIGLSDRARERIDNRLKYELQEAA